MTVTMVFRKTQKGQDEISSRTLKLSVKMRSILIAVDGKRTNADLERGFASVGNVQEMLAELEKNGCIECVPETAAPKAGGAGKPRPLNVEALRYMSNYLYDVLGPDSETMVVRLEKCKNNGELEKMLNEGRSLLTQLGHKSKAEEFYVMGQEMLSL